MATFTGVRFQWILLTGSVVINYLELGILKSFGVFIDDISWSLGVSTGFVGTAIGVSHGLTQSMAVVCPWLMTYVSMRKLVISGSIMGSLGIILGSFSQTGNHFLLCLILSGIGYGVVVFPAFASLLDYFSDKYKTVNAVIITAGGVGMMTLPILTEELRRVYSWRGAMLLLSGISTHCVACCALFRPIRYPSTRLDTDGDTSDLNSIHAGDAIDDDDDGADSSTSQLLNSHNSHGNRTSTSNEREPHSSLKELFQRHPLYLSIITSVVLTGTSYTAWIIFVIPNAEAKGFPPSEAVFLATIGGAANVLGRIVLGFISSRNLLEDRLTFCLLHFFAAVIFFLNRIAHSFLMLALLSFASGFLFGGLIVIHTILPQSLVSPELVRVALSLHYLIGIGEVGGGAIVGVLYDKHGSYDFAFTVAGLIDLGAILVIFVPAACQKIYPEHSRRKRCRDACSTN